MTTFAFIFARGGSVGVPRKNIRNLCGKPLIAYSIDIARSIPEIQEIYVSTDDAEISKISLEFGAKVIDRPKDLAQSDSPEWLAWRHAVETLHASDIKFDVFLSLPTTSPLRTTEDVQCCLRKLDESTDIVLSMSPARRNPSFNMVSLKAGYIRLLNENSSIFRRQDAPPVYDLATIAYVTTPEYILNSNGIFSGRVSGVEIPQERTLDIDTEYDFLLAELLIEHSKQELNER